MTQKPQVRKPYSKRNNFNAGLTIKTVANPALPEPATSSATPSTFNFIIQDSEVVALTTEIKYLVIVKLGVDGYLLYSKKGRIGYKGRNLAICKAHNTRIIVQVFEEKMPSTLIGQSRKEALKDVSFILNSTILSLNDNFQRLRVCKPNYTVLSAYGLIRTLLGFSLRLSSCLG